LNSLTLALVDGDGSIVTDFLAILYYLEDYYPTTLSLLPIEKAKHIYVLQRILESQNLLNIYESLKTMIFKASRLEQSFHKDFIVKTLDMIDQLFRYSSSDSSMT
jgi:glutathione S-transferase